MISYLDELNQKVNYIVRIIIPNGKKRICLKDVHDKSATVSGAEILPVYSPLNIEVK